jgi:hypothetical protein
MEARIVVDDVDIRKCEWCGILIGGPSVFSQPEKEEKTQQQHISYCL